MTEPHPAAADASSVDLSNGIAITDDERRGYHAAIDGLVAAEAVSDLEQEQIRIAKQAVEDLYKARLALPLLAMIPTIGPFVGPVDAAIERLLGALSGGR